MLIPMYTCIIPVETSRAEYIAQLNMLMPTSITD